MFKIKKIEDTNKFEVFQVIKSLDLEYNEIDTLIFIGNYSTDMIVEEKLKYSTMINNLDILLNELYKFDK